ncbi:MAG: hypothetical protein HC905_25915 [Bacteroidales bacterium]|nr:hypothetical protein [Bacteroidales bacterium]
MAAPGSSKGEKQLLITGQGHRNHDELFAWYRTTTGDSVKKVTNWLAGAVNVVSYEKRTLKLCLVSVNNSVSPDAGYVQSEINKIYRQAVVSWEVTSLKDGISVTLPRNNQKQLDNTDTNNQMDYTPEMKLVYNAMKNNPAYDKHTIYLFFFDEGTKDINGNMPFNRKFGFIFKYRQNPDEYIHTIAHELGHGAFRLRHTFSPENTYIQAKGTTDNLMDYSAANALALNKYQWDECHDRDLGLNWGEGEEEGESLSIANVKCIAENSKLSGSIFLDPEGNPIDLGDAKPYAFFSTKEHVLQGRLAAFKKNNLLYVAYREGQNSEKYAGFYAPSERSDLKIIPQKVPDRNNAIYVFISPENVVTTRTGSNENISSEIYPCACEGFKKNEDTGSLLIDLTSGLDENLKKDVLNQLLSFEKGGLKSRIYVTDTTKFDANHIIIKQYLAKNPENEVVVWLHYDGEDYNLKEFSIGEKICY